MCLLLSVKLHWSRNQLEISLSHRHYKGSLRLSNLSLSFPFRNQSYFKLNDYIRNLIYSYIIIWGWWVLGWSAHMDIFWGLFKSTHHPLLANSDNISLQCICDGGDHKNISWWTYYCDSLSNCAEVSIAFFSSRLDTTDTTVKVSIAFFSYRLDTTVITVCKSRYLSSDPTVKFEMKFYLLFYIYSLCLYL